MSELLQVMDPVAIPLTDQITVGAIGSFVVWFLYNELRKANSTVDSLREQLNKKNEEYLLKTKECYEREIELLNLTKTERKRSSGRS